MCLKCLLVPIMMTAPFLLVGIIQEKSLAHISVAKISVLLFALFLGGVIVFLLFFDKKDEKEKVSNEAK